MWVFSVFSLESGTSFYSIQTDGLPQDLLRQTSSMLGRRLIALTTGTSLDALLASTLISNGSRN